MKKFTLLIALICVLFTMQSVQANPKTILFVPADDRPVSDEYVVDTAQAAGVNMLTPPRELLGNRTSLGNPDALWEWVFNHEQEADAIVVSGDTMLYGSLVGSREHNFSNDVLQRRMDNFAKLKQTVPLTPLYVFATIMRSPKASAGGVEPDYYEKYAHDIFQITALEDKRDIEPLSHSEEAELQKLSATVPQTAMSAWMSRRGQNYAMDVQLIGNAQNGTFDYLIMGRDDSSPFSQSHREFRSLAKVAQGLTASHYTSFPGADQLGMLMVTRAINNFSWKLPIVQVLYAPGAGPKTVPTYEDQEVGKTIPDQIAAAGGIMLDNAVNPDLILAVNTPENGKTLEANSPANRGKGQTESADFANQIGTELANGMKVAVANIAYSNGADNHFMYEMDRQHLLPKLETISGWNTASNTIGYTIGQGMLAPQMLPAAKNQLLAVRLLDDWAYQANVRENVADTVLWPAGGNYFYLNKLAPRITAETQSEIQAFAASNLQDFDIRNMDISFPWNRMFEIGVKVN